MRLATIDLENWQEHAPFVDTLCLPVYPLKFTDKQLHIAQGREIERIAGLVEKKLTGRLLLIPAISYISDDAQFHAYLMQVIAMLKKSGFHYLVLLSDRPLNQSADPTISSFCVTSLDHHRSEEDLDEEAEKCFQQVVDLWVKNT